MKTKNEDKLTKDTVTPLNKISCKLASQFYGKMKFVAPTAEKRIKNAGFDEETTRLIYSIPFKVTKDTRLAIFQFKITHHILPTNATLFRDSLYSSKQCHFCTKKQTLKHLTCSYMRSFWADFTNWWNTKNSEAMSLSETEIIYGFTNGPTLCLGLNLCVILAKNYIYTASRRDEAYIWQAFLAFLKSYLS